MFFEKGETMSEEEKKFLEIVDLKKGFGSGETRQKGTLRPQCFPSRSD